MDSQKVKAHLCLLIVNIIYGANFVIAKQITPKYVLPLGFIVMRVGVCTGLYWLLCCFLKQNSKQYAAKYGVFSKKNYVHIFICAILGVATNQMLFFKGLSLTSPINAALIMITTPILTLLAATLLINEKLNRQKIVGLVFGAFGAATIIIGSHHYTSISESNITGDVCVFINAISYALYLVFVKPLMKNFHPFRIIKWVFFCGFFIVLPFGYTEFLAIKWHTFDASVWWAIGYVLVFTTFVTYLLNIYALQKVNASTVGIYIYLQPIIATFIALAFGKDELNYLHFISALPIFVGVYLVSVSSNTVKKQLK